MKPTHYVDFQMIAGDDTLSLPVVTNAVYAVLHGAFRQLEKHRFALALPKAGKTGVGDVLRIFSSDRDSLDALVEAVSNHTTVRDYSKILYPRAIPENYQGDWVVFRRFRIPNRNADRKEDQALNGRKKHEAEKRRLPYFNIKSRSTQKFFRLYVDVKSSQPVEGEPDSYGLSRAENPIALPLI